LEALAFLFLLGVGGFRNQQILFIKETLCLGDPKLKSDSLLTALKKDKEIELIVTGRKSGKPIPRPVWFVLRGTELLLLPVTGTDSQWYKNVLRNSQVKLRASQQTFEGRLHAITQKKQVDEVIELFKGKYGSSDIKRYYPNPNAAAVMQLD